MSGCHFSIQVQLQPLLVCVNKIFKSISNSLSYSYRILDRLLPSAATSALLSNELPTISLWMSGNDERHFKSAHEKSLRNGYRTNKAAEFRKVHVTVKNKRHSVDLALDDCYDNVNYKSKRQSFVIMDKEKKLIGGSGLARLYPPELHPLFHPDAPYPLPHNSQIVRLSIDDSFKGLYVLESFDLSGSAYLLQGTHDRKQALHYNSTAVPSATLLPYKDNAASFKRNSKLFDSDILFPWSRAEIIYQQKKLKKLHKHYSFSEYSPEIIHPSEILGANPALLFITNSLSLPSKTPSGDNIVWESSDVLTVSTEGLVNRPEGNEFKFITLTASTVADKQVFRLRIIPEHPLLPTLFLNVGRPVEKFKRRDFSAVFMASDGAAKVLIGTGDKKGGIRHRGNTSYVKAAKRSLSLEFDEPVIWPGLTNKVEHILVYSGYADATRLRNKISFDAYRLSAESRNSEIPSVIPYISFIEYFVNGEYMGIVETGHRMRDLTPENLLMYKVRARSDLWMDQSTDMVECECKASRQENPYEPLEKLFHFTSDASKEDFAAGVGEKFYTENLIDYYLMLNFTQNSDAKVNNQYIARMSGENRFFLIPWDYDKTFFPNPGGVLSNHLFQRLISEVTGFKSEVNDRWKFLRSTVLSDSEIFGRIDEDVKLLSPYMEEEYRILQPLGEDGNFDQALQKLKNSISIRLKQMDEKLK